MNVIIDQKKINNFLFMKNKSNNSVIWDQLELQLKSKIIWIMYIKSTKILLTWSHTKQKLTKKILLLLLLFGERSISWFTWLNVSVKIVSLVVDNFYYFIKIVSLVSDDLHDC